MTLTPGMEVTIEEDDGQNLTYSVGNSGIILKIVRCFAIVSCSNRVVGCLTQYLQPKITQALIEANMEQLV